jgi:hypothetical protein
MEREKHKQEENLLEMIIEYVKWSLEFEPLYKPRASDLKPFRIKAKDLRGWIDPRFEVDHLYVDEQGHMTQHPYSMGMKKVKELIEFCEERGYTFEICGDSPYYPTRTFQIVFEKNVVKSDGTN